MGLPARRRDLWILATVLTSEKKLIKKSTHSVWISVFAAAAAASASAGIHSVNESLANLDESLYAVIDFQPQPLKKKKNNFFCCFAVDIISLPLFLLDAHVRRAHYSQASSSDVV